MDLAQKEDYLQQLFRDVFHNEIDYRTCSFSYMPASASNFAAVTTLAFSRARRSRLFQLPSWIKHFVGLQTFIVHDLPDLRELPDSLGRLTALQSLYINDCSNLVRLPDQIKEFTKLDHLEIHRCFNLTALPAVIGQLASLRYLIVTESRISCLPDSVGDLAMLETIRIQNCNHMHYLPTTISRCSKLRTIDILGPLTELPDLSNLKSLLQLHVTSRLITCLPPSVNELKELQTLDISWCINLVSLPEIGNLVSLQKLNIYLCRLTLPKSIGVLALSEIITSDWRLHHNISGHVKHPHGHLQVRTSTHHVHYFTNYRQTILTLIMASSRRKKLRQPPSEIWELVLHFVVGLVGH